ncbi:MAG: hypothetical protein JKY59_02835, partial [Emcibacter sp.]|nr:hypothetical protein [Emcibacter sp.]
MTLFSLKLFSRILPVLFGLILVGCSNNTVAPTESVQHRQNLDETNYAKTYDEKSIVNAASDFLGGGSEAIAKVIEKAFK